MNFKDQKPIYLQIAESICESILAGKYRENEKLPSVREFAAEVEVNVNTVARSFEWLQNQDVVATRRGLGNFVNEGARESVLRIRRKEFFDLSFNGRGGTKSLCLCSGAGWRFNNERFTLCYRSRPRRR